MGWWNRELTWVGTHCRPGGRASSPAFGFSRGLRAVISAPRTITCGLLTGAKQIRNIRRTLFIRYLDNQPEDLVAAAFADAERRGVGPICVFMSYSAELASLRALLADPRVQSVGSKDNPFNSLLPDDLSDNPRVGRFWDPGVWALPAGATHVYFVGSWRLFTRYMLREAVSRDVTSLRVRVAKSWVSVPLDAVRTIHRRLRPLIPAAMFVFRGTRSIWHGARRVVARSLLLVRPNSIELAARLVGPAGLDGGVTLQRVFIRVLEAPAASGGAVPRRVVHVCGNLQPGGAERQLVYTLEGLSRQNLESVQLLCHDLTRGKDRNDFYLPDVKASGVKVREIRRRTAASDPASIPPPLRKVARLLPGGLLRDVCNLYWEFAELKPEIVHAWLDWDNVRAGLAAVLAGVPKVILSGRNINPSHFQFYAPYMDPAYQALARIPTVTLINNSRACGDDYADWIGIPRSRIGVVHNGVDFGDRKRLSVDAATALRRSLGIPADAFVVGGAFRLAEEKRPLLWVETAACVAKEVADAWFVLFGEGRMRDQFLRRAQRAGIADRLVLPGVTNEIVSAMSIMDVLLLTSFGEGLPNVLLEAQWAGTPVVTTDVGGAKEAIDVGVTGWAIASDRAADLAKQIVWLNAHPQVRADVRDQGPAFVRDKFGVERMIRNVMRVYGWV